MDGGMNCTTFWIMIVVYTRRIKGEICCDNKPSMAAGSFGFQFGKPSFLWIPITIHLSFTDEEAGGTREVDRRGNNELSTAM